MYSDQFTALMNTLFIRKYLPVPLVQNIFLLIEEKIITSSITLHICTFKIRCKLSTSTNSDVNNSYIYYYCC